jgi:hypothetical protein
MFYLKLARLRLWRRYRRHFLSTFEMSVLPDLTVPEVLMIASAYEKAIKNGMAR